MIMMKQGLRLSTFCLSIFASVAMAHEPPIVVDSKDQKIVDIYAVDEKGINQKLGTVRIVVIKYGLLFEPNLKGLVPGEHGFHIHQLPNCMPADNQAAGAAGTHYDPANTGFHGGPYGEGHLGDLPTLHVDLDGSAKSPVLAPRLHTLQEMTGRSVMIHVGGDNYGNDAGGARLACGVIK